MPVLLEPLLTPDAQSPPWGAKLAPLLSADARSLSWGAKLAPIFGDPLNVRIGIGTRVDVSVPMNVPVSGLSPLMSGILGHTTPGTLTLKLFTNNVWPTGIVTAESFTEMTGQGYFPAELAPTGWRLSRDETGGSVATHNKINWQFTPGSTTIYGYYVVAADGTIRWAARFTTPFFASTADDRLALAPKMSFRMAT